MPYIICCLLPYEINFPTEIRHREKSNEETFSHPHFRSKNWRAVPGKGRPETRTTFGAGLGFLRFRSLPPPPPLKWLRRKPPVYTRYVTPCMVIWAGQGTESPKDLTFRVYRHSLIYFSPPTTRLGAQWLFPLHGMHCLLPLFEVLNRPPPPPPLYSNGGGEKEGERGRGRLSTPRERDGRGFDEEEPKLNA